MLQANPYIFDKHRVRFPPYLSVIIPVEVRLASRHAHNAAGMAFQALKQLELHHAERFRRVCPMEPATRFNAHVTSIDRLLAWKPQYHQDHTLHSTPKIPEFQLRFHVEENAYKSYQNEYEEMRLAYLNGPYLRWWWRKRQLDELLAAPSIQEMDRKLSQRWWDEFLEEMAQWDRRVDVLILPTWAEIITELTELIEERVDLSNEWGKAC